MLTHLNILGHLQNSYWHYVMLTGFANANVSFMILDLNCSVTDTLKHLALYLSVRAYLSPSSFIHQNGLMMGWEEKNCSLLIFCKYTKQGYFIESCSCHHHPVYRTFPHSKNFELILSTSAGSGMPVRGNH